MKKKLAATLSVVLILGLAVLGILAYLTSEDSDINVMTLGNVEIEQIEQERDASGNLDKFTQNKPAFPAVGQIAWDETKLDVNGTEYKVFDDGLKNVVDKIVTVKNTGKSPAYVRTLVALEAPNYDPTDLIHINHNGDGVTMSAPVNAEIEGAEYVVFEFTYNAALEPNTISVPSLMQVFLDSETTNEDCAAFGDDWEIRVLSQAVQTEGFADAKTALDTAFGVADKANIEAWFTGMPRGERVKNADELKSVLAKGGTAVLTEDIVVTADDTTGYGQHMFLANGKDSTINLNGCNITVAENASQIGSLFTVANGGEINIIGDGNVEIKNGKAFIGWTLNGSGNINVYGGNFFGNGHEGNNALFYVQDNTGKIDVYGGKFTYPVANNDNWGFNAHNGVGDKLVIEIHEGALLQHEAFQFGDDSRIQLAEGCSLQAVVIDGTTWYQVVK